MGLAAFGVDDWSQHKARSYAWVRDRVVENRERLAQRVGTETVEGTVESLSFRVDSANAGKIGWAFFVARNPD